MSGAHDSVDEPRLTAKFGGHPSSGVGDIGQRGTEHEQPKHPASFEKFFAPKEKSGDGHDGDENGA